MTRVEGATGRDGLAGGRWELPRVGQEGREEGETTSQATLWRLCII